MATVGRRLSILISHVEVGSHERRQAFKDIILNAGLRSRKSLSGAGALPCSVNRWSYLRSYALNGSNTGAIAHGRLCGSVWGPCHTTFKSLSTVADDSSGGTGSPSHVLRVPPLGESITEGTVVQWKRGVGCIVHAEEVVCVLETDKVSVDIRADIPGRIVKTVVDVGGTAFVGGEIAVIETLSPEAAAEANEASVTSKGRSNSMQDVPSSSQAGSRVNDASTASASTESTPQHKSRKPLILFRSVRKRLEKLGMLPRQPLESHTERNIPKQDKLDAKPAAVGKSSATVIT